MADVKRHRLGWIGAGGRMGYAFVARLLQEGADVAVYNRTRSKVEPLADLGAAIRDSPLELADRDIVFTSVAAGDDLVAVLDGPQGLLGDESVAPLIIVDVSTVSADASAAARKLADAREAMLLAAPVSGNAKVVKAGKATFAVSGPRSAFETAEPYLAALGTGVHHVGEGEGARLVKIAHNLMLGTVIQTMVETSLLVEAEGISRADYLAFLNDSVMGSMFTRYKTPALVALDWTPTFTPTLLHKDLSLGIDAAAANGSAVPLTERARELVQEAIDAGRSDQDFAVMLELQAAKAGIELEPDTRPVSSGL